MSDAPKINYWEIPLDQRPEKYVQLFSDSMDEIENKYHEITLLLKMPPFSLKENRVMAKDIYLAVLKEKAKMIKTLQSKPLSEKPYSKIMSAHEKHFKEASQWMKVSEKDWEKSQLLYIKKNPKTRLIDFTFTGNNG